MSAPEDSLLRIRREGGALSFSVRVAPRASRQKVLGLHDGALKVALTAPPVDGKANAALIAFLAKSLGCPKKALRITQGLTSKQKTLRVEGASADLEARLRSLAGG